MERIGNKSAFGGISVALPVNHAALQPPPPGRLHSTHQPPPLQPSAASRPPPRSVAAGSSCFAGRRLTGALASRSPTSTTHSCSATRAHRTVRARRTAARRASSRLAAGSRLPRGTSSWSAVCGRAPVVPLGARVLSAAGPPARDGAQIGHHQDGCGMQLAAAGMVCSGWTTRTTTNPWVPAAASVACAASSMLCFWSYERVSNCVCIGNNRAYLKVVACSC
ncbi:hypothetical protein PVAP13_4KG080400 [Panicum virgatum]|uniref:Uncharacterized protein n=1 Tax=Panicum virgatum TaxID=38727 RepID=A0A8T0TIB3_PANVG|nr:hypothetical protein PVAP13_4KG080400 [Panicum virgatum]KAG2609967.1 hypothetical protein PVAP13_4KG080400 [Panicum virgatum]